MGFGPVSIKWRIHHQKPHAHKSHQLRSYPVHSKISLTPHNDSRLNLVLSLSNDVRLETTGNQFNGRPFELAYGSKVFDYISLCVRQEKSFGHSKILLDSKEAQCKIRGFNTCRVRCKISLKFVLFSKVIIDVRYRAIFIQWIN